MHTYFGIILILSFIILVLIRSLSLKKKGIQAVEFGQKNKSDFILPPFALFYFYILLSNTFPLPTIPSQQLFYSEFVSWIGVALGVCGFLFFVWTLISFKNSFRVGLANNTAQGLITTGAFTISRNPIYVAFATLLISEFLIYGSWILFIYIIAGIITFHIQVLREEAFLKEQYGQVFETYCNNVRRYL